MSVEVVTVGMVAPALVLLPFWVAEDLGEFKRRDLDVVTEVIGSTEGTSAALLDDRIDISFAQADPALENPSEVTILVGFADRPPLSLVAQPSITRVADLAGRSIGTTSLREGTALLVQTIMSAHGLRFPEDYTFVQAGAHPQRWQALQEGAIVAALQMMPYDLLAEEAGFTILARAEDYVPQFAFGSACARQRWVHTHPEAATAFIEALRVGERIIRDRPGRVAQIAAAKVQVSESHARRCVDRLVAGQVMPVGLVHSTPALNRARQAMVESTDLSLGL